MSLTILLAVWAVALVLALAALALIVRPLLLILTEICGGYDRARFWTVYACVLTLMAPLLAVSTPGLLDTVALSGSIGAILQRAVFYALGGIIAALLVMGRAVWRPIALMLQTPAARTCQDHAS